MHDYIKVCVVVFSHHEEFLKSEIKVEIKVNSVYPWIYFDVFKIKTENLIRK